jgi:hypothetical protein
MTSTGAKLITPFGLFGGCGSRGFKRRLREEYHSAPTGDDLNTMQIIKFLQDFVIDFGPADFGQDPNPSQESAKPPLELPLINEDTGSAKM